MHSQLVTQGKVDFSVDPCNHSTFSHLEAKQRTSRVYELPSNLNYPGINSNTFNAIVHTLS